MNGQEIPAIDPGQDPGGPPDERLSFRAAGESDHDAFARRPARCDALAGPVFRQPLIDPVCQPDQGDLPQREEVAKPKFVGKGSVNHFRRIDVSGREPLPQKFRGNVHEFDLVRPAHNFVGTVSPGGSRLWRTRRLPARLRCWILTVESTSMPAVEQLARPASDAHSGFPGRWCAHTRPRRQLPGCRAKTASTSSSWSSTPPLGPSCWLTISSPAMSSRVSFRPWSRATPTTTSRPLPAAGGLLQASQRSCPPPARRPEKCEEFPLP